MSKKIFGVELKTANWVKGDDMVMYLNGVDEIVRLDGTNKTATKTIKEPQMVVYHAGETRSLKDLRANAGLDSELAPAPPDQEDKE